MAQAKHQMIPLGGLNTDDGYSVMAPTDYQVAENVSILVSEDGKQAYIKNVKGTTLITNSDLPSGVNRVVGQVEDRQKSRIYYFVYNTNGQDVIYCYRRKENDIKPVLKSSSFASPETKLNLSTNRLYYISGISVIGDFLFWTDYNNQPRRINVERGLRTYDGSYTSPNGSTPDIYNTGSMLDEDITIIRRPPRYPLELRKIDSSADADVPDQTNNFIKNEAFQFAYRYVYRDNERSVLSTYSKLQNYNSDDPDSTDFDTIEVCLPKRETIPYEVKQIEMCVRYGNTGSWYVIKTYDRSTDSAEFDNHNASSTAALCFNFFNNRLGVAISDEESTRLFDNVPLKSRALVAARNRIFLGNNEYGYDKPTGISISAEVVSQAGQSALTGEYVLITYNSSFFSDFDVVLVKVDSGDPDIDGYYFHQSTTTGNWLEATFDNGLLPVIKTYSPSDRVFTFAEVAGGLLEIKTWLEFSPVGGNYRSATTHEDYPATQPQIQGLTEGANPTDGFRQFKSNSQYQVGVVFYDFADRKHLVVTGEDAKVNTPDRNFTFANYSANIKWTLAYNSTDIPLWATHYAIVRTENLTINSFIQHYTNNIRYVTRSDAEVDTTNLKGWKVESINNVTTYDKERVVGVAYDISRLASDGLGYTFLEGNGDVLRGYSSDNTTKFILPIIGQIGEWVIVSPVDLGDISSGSNQNRTQIIEIYSPNRAAGDIFYEVGEVYEVSGSGTENRMLSVTEGYLDGDVYIKQRDYLDSGTINVEAMNINDDYYLEWLTDIGRPNTSGGDIGSKVLPTNIAYSATWVQGSSINGLCSFSGLDFRDLAFENGAIQKLVLNSTRPDRASVMLAIGSTGTASLLLGESQLVDNADQAIVATSGEVIGTINNLLGGFGTMHPESVAVGNSEAEGYVYWFDAYNGKVVRAASNGMEPISNSKLSYYFVNQAERALTGDFLIPGGFDGKSDEYLIYFPEMVIDFVPEYLEDFLEEVDVLEYVKTSPKEGIDLGITPKVGETYVFEIAGQDSSGTASLYYGEELIGSVSGVNTETFTYTVQSPGSSFIVIHSKAVIYTVSKYRLSPHDFDDGQAKVIAFSEKTKRFSRSYTFSPESMAISGNLLISFKSGNLYKHNNKTSYNTFYGVQHPSKFSFVVNTAPSSVKIFKSIAQSGTQEPYWTHFRCEDRDQSSDFSIGFWKKKEYIYYAPILKDRLSPNVTGDADTKKFKGDDLRSQFMQVHLEWRNFTSEFYVYFIDVGFNVSSGHKLLMNTNS